jgi:hypothetical protein
MNTFLGLLATERTQALTPAVAGLTVGAIVGVVGFVAVLLLVGRANRRRATPLPPVAFRMPGHPPALPFHPSTDLAARAFARMSDDCEAEDDCDFEPPAPKPVRAADTSAPHPLGIIPTGSRSMRAPGAETSPRPASFADLEMDDAVTEIAETYFDEPPQPLRRTDAPRIRALAPAGPRFESQ